jgi:hypothetical protein
MATKADILADVIRSRVTEKVLANDDFKHQLSAEVEAENDQKVLAALETAGWALFHYPRNVDDIVESWRVYFLNREQAEKAAAYLSDDLGVKSKEPMLAKACNSLVLITWLPETNPDNVEHITLRNNEHLAASSAMVQNLLLMLTAEEMGNYWSSGGKFGSAEMFDYLNISNAEALLAAVFIEYPDAMSAAEENKQRKPGAHRDKRSLAWIQKLEN